MKKRIILAPIVFLLVSLRNSPAQNFKVSGTKIISPSGQEFVARGVNVGGYNYNKSAGATIRDADLIIDAWKFNLIRVNCKMFYNDYNYGYTENDNLNAVIDTFTSKKCVVLFDGGHDRIGSFYEGSELDSLKNFYRRLAILTKNNPYVWFDLVNEPDNNYQKPGNRQKWSFMMQELIKVIRSTGNENIIVICGGSWGQDAGGGGCNDVPDSWSHILSWYDDVMNFGGKAYQNIAFTFHVYNSWNCSKERMASYLDRIAARNLAIIAGEYGSENESNSTLSATRHLFELCAERKIGKAVWHWSNGDNNDLVKKVAGTTRETSNNGGGREINQTVAPTNLTELGEIIWNDNHNAATGTLERKTYIPYFFEVYQDTQNEITIVIDPKNKDNDPEFSIFNLNGQRLFRKKIAGYSVESLNLNKTIKSGFYIAVLHSTNNSLSKMIFLK